MVRKQGGLITTFTSGENVVDRCIAKVKEVEPDSLADKLLHITIKTPKAYARFKMDGFDFTTDGNGNFASIAIAGVTTPEIRDIRFEEDMTENCVICFIY